MTACVYHLLNTSGLDNVDARLLLQHVLAVSHVWLIAHRDEQVTAQQAAQFSMLVKRRLQGEPIAYLIGRREFYGLDLAVTPAVLIPRPETELLVELALTHISSDSRSDVLELGTGSGAIAIAIAKSRPLATICATDLSTAALEVARQNAKHHQANIHFVQGDWFAPVANQQFDIIVANPPYIRCDDRHLGQGDLRFEPPGALTDYSVDGLLALNTIIEQAARYLKANGAIWLEHGYDQAAACRLKLQAYGFTKVQSVRDMASIERVSGGIKE